MFIQVARYPYSSLALAQIQKLTIPDWNVCHYRKEDIDHGRLHGKTERLEGPLPEKLAELMNRRSEGYLPALLGFTLYRYLRARASLHGDCEAPSGPQRLSARSFHHHAGRYDLRVCNNHQPSEDAGLHNHRAENQLPRTAAKASLLCEGKAAHIGGVRWYGRPRMDEKSGRNLALFRCTKWSCRNSNKPFRYSPLYHLSIRMRLLLRRLRSTRPVYPASPYCEYRCPSKSLQWRWPCLYGERSLFHCNAYKINLIKSSCCPWAPPQDDSGF